MRITKCTDALQVSLPRSPDTAAPASDRFRRVPSTMPRRGTSHLTARPRCHGGGSTGGLVLDASVPVGAVADVELPWGAGVFRVGHGQHSWQVAEPAGVQLPISTVRQLMDVEAAWSHFSAVVLDAGLAPSEQRLAQLLAAYLDRPVIDLLDGVWTKGWPAECAKQQLQMAVTVLTTDASADSEDHYV